MKEKEREKKEEDSTQRALENPRKKKLEIEGILANDRI